MMSFEKRGKNYFNSGFNCAESVLLALSGDARFSERAQGCIPRIATGFGGGMALNGDVCGALTGGIMAIGLALGREEPSQSRTTCYSAVERFYQDFKKEFGTCKCSELTGVNLKTAEGTEAHQTKIRVERCEPIVAWASKRIEQIVEELQQT
jgi:C_GCAxxG_C_C family probable redox protein